MPKRKDQLTGGSGDVNPQYMIFTVAQPGVDANTKLAQQLPIPRLPTREGKNLVMEVLEVEYFLNTPTAGVINTTPAFVAAVSTNPNLLVTGLQIAQDPRTMSFWANALTNINNTGVFDQEVQHVDDLTDRAGHGILIATDQLYFQVQSGATTQANVVVFRLLYRMKEVSLVEYIGIVQSQQ